jgi:glycogen(starch) synthase
VPSRNEPFGIVTLEAWSAGKPVIAMHGTGSGDLVWHNVTGLQVFRNPDSIAWGVTHLFSDYEKARWMGNNGRHAVETVFTWDNMADKTLEVYNEIL